MTKFDIARGFAPGGGGSAQQGQHVDCDWPVLATRRGSWTMANIDTTKLASIMFSPSNFIYSNPANIDTTKLASSNVQPFVFVMCSPLLVW